MKISTRLSLLSGLSAAALALVAGVSWYAVTSIQSDLQGLTGRATPLQTKTYELHERTERLMGALLRLSLATGREDADRAGASAQHESQAIDKLRGEIRALDAKAGEAGADFRGAQAEIVAGVDRRLADEEVYRRESAAATEALGKAEQAVAVTRKAAQQIGVEAGQAADKAQDAAKKLGNAIRIILSAQARLKELVVVVSEADLATNRFRLSPLKDKFKSPIDSIQRLEADPGSDDPLKELRPVAAGLFEAATKDGSGLLALRAAVLAKAPDAEAAYGRQRKAIVDPVEQQIAKLNSVLDATEAQAAKQRQVLEAALKLRNEPGGVVGKSEEVSLHIREMVGGLRLMMLAAAEAEVSQTLAELVAVADDMTADMRVMRDGLVKLGRPQLAPQVDTALAAIASVKASVAKVAASKRQLLASQAQMARLLANLKQVASEQAKLGDEQVARMSRRQAEVVASVDQRVHLSLVAILAIAGAAIAVTVALSLRLVRTVTRRLNAAVEVAERVSRGELVPVKPSSGNDETTRLMAAMASMVGRLEDIVARIRQSADRIHADSREITAGNQHLSTRSEDQSAQLKQTAASVDELTGSTRRNVETAHTASTLAGEASAVASRGGTLVESVVDTMSQIEDSSRQIAAIVSVIDGIAFQTNILALNAAVEAARAGEQGRGFAVVASEVRALAAKSAEAAREVKTIVERSVSAIAGGAEVVRDAGSTMHEIVQQAQRVSALIDEIARSSDSQVSSVEAVGRAVQALDELTQQNAALAEQGSGAAADLYAEAESLAQSIAVFRTAAA